MKKRNLSKTGIEASFTVEASLLLPPVLAVLLLVLYLFGHVHNRTVLTAYACEQAVSGKEQQVTVLYLANDVTENRSGSKKKREVSYSYRTTPLVWPVSFEEEEKASYEITDPVSLAHRAYAAKSLFE